MKLDKKLTHWQESGIISDKQRLAILQFEQQSGNSNWVLYGFMMLGAAVMGIGIISVIAANWADIPVWLKLGIDFALLGLIGSGLFVFYQRNSMAYETLLISFQILCLASIGLISQIYHTGGMLYQAVFFWSLITLPITLHSSRYFAAFLWASLFLSSSLWMIVEYRYAMLGLENRWWNIENHLASLLLLTPLLSILYAQISDITKQIRLANSFRFWFIVTAIASLIFADIVYWTKDWTGFTAGLFLPAYIAAALLVILLAISTQYKPLSKVFLISAIGLLLILFHPELFAIDQWEDDFLQKLFAPIIIITILILYALHLAISKQKTLFNLVTFLIGLRFLFVYFEAMGGLAATGIGLILSGLVIIGISYGWYRSRASLQAWVANLT